MIEEYVRDFFREPSVGRAQILIHSIRRLGLKLPSNGHEVISFCHGNKICAEFFVKAMDYGIPGNIAFDLYKNYGFEESFWKDVVDSFYEKYLVALQNFNFKKDKKSGATLVHWVKLNGLENDFLEISHLRNIFHGNVKLMELYISSMDYGDPSFLSRQMMVFHKSSEKWAKDVIENDLVGAQLFYGFYLVDKGMASREWLENIVEKYNKKYREPRENYHFFGRRINLESELKEISQAMVNHLGSSKEWLKKIRIKHGF